MRIGKDCRNQYSSRKIFIFRPISHDDDDGEDDDDVNPALYHVTSQLQVLAQQNATHRTGDGKFFIQAEEQLLLRLVIGLRF